MNNLQNSLNPIYSFISKPFNEYKETIQIYLYV